MGNPQPEPSMDEILASIRRIISEDEDTAGAANPVQDQLNTLEEKSAELTTQPEAIDVAPELPEAEAVEVEAPIEAAVEKTPEPVEPEAELIEQPAEDDGTTAIDLGEITLGVSEEVVDEPITDPPTAAAEPAPVQEEALFEQEDTIDAVAEMPSEQIEETSPVEEPDMSDAAEQLIIRKPIPKAEAPASPVSLEDDGFLAATTASAAADAFDTLSQNVRMSAGNSTTLEDMVEKMMQPLLKRWLDDNLPRIVEEKVEDEIRRLARRQ